MCIWNHFLKSCLVHIWWCYTQQGTNLCLRTAAHSYFPDNVTLDIVFIYFSDVSWHISLTSSTTGILWIGNIQYMCLKGIFYSCFNSCLLGSHTSLLILGENYWPQVLWFYQYWSYCTFVLFQLTLIRGWRFASSQMWP